MSSYLKIGVLGLLLTTMPCLCFAGPKTRLEGLFYTVPLNYGNSLIKDDGIVMGAYGFYGYGLNHSFEGGLDYTKINYRSGSDLEQLDFTLLYSNYSIYSYIFRAGSHYIASDDSYSDKAISLFGGVSYYIPKQLDVGLDGYVSIYQNYEPNLSDYQYVPKIGFSFKKSRNFSVYFQTKGHFIHLSEEVGLHDSNFFSIEENVTITFKKWVLGGFVWFGEQVFAVRDNGFSVYNLPEKHTGGYGIYQKYLFFKKCSATFGFYREYFTDFGIPENNVEATKFVLSFGYTF